MTRRELWAGVDMHPLIPFGIGVRLLVARRADQIFNGIISAVVVAMPIAGFAFVPSDDGEMRRVRLIAAMGVDPRCRHGAEMRQGDRQQAGQEAAN